MEDRLRRFRAISNELENRTNVCPECDAPLELVVKTPRATPGDIASLIEFYYCSECNIYYMHKRNTDEGTKGF